MRTHRIWIEILLLGTAIACVLALLIASLGVAAGTATDESSKQATPPTNEQTYEGMVTCSRCGAKHSAALGEKAADCARTCVRGGATFVLVEGNATYLLDGDLGVLGKVGRAARSHCR